MMVGRERLKIYGGGIYHIDQVVWWKIGFGPTRARSMLKSCSLVELRLVEKIIKLCLAEEWAVEGKIREILATMVPSKFGRTTDQ